MGLDSVELLMEVEERFGIEVTDEEAAKVVTVGDLHELVVAKLGVQPGRRCVTQHVFYRIRRGLVEQFGRDRRCMSTTSDVELLVPRSERRRAWDTLGKHVGLKLPELVRPDGLVVAMLSVFLGAALTAILGAGLGLLPSVWCLSIGLCAVPGLWFAFWATEPLAVKVPQGSATLGTAARQVTSLNFAQLTRENEVNRDDIWHSVCSTVEDQLSVPAGTLLPETRFITELGLG